MVTTKHRIDEEPEKTPPNRWEGAQVLPLFGKIVERARRDGAQFLEADDQEPVVILSMREYQKLRGFSGGAIVDAMRACPVDDFEFGEDRREVTYRDVDV